jgi:hypothetical protein
MTDSLARIPELSLTQIMPVASSVDIDVQNCWVLMLNCARD